jgi:NAD(P)-dependent dehydrogenase (short-subunit alcohol dehydrogenase family)
VLALLFRHHGSVLAAAIRLAEEGADLILIDRCESLPGLTIRLSV